MDFGIATNGTVHACCQTGPMRVVAGYLGGRKLVVPKGDHTRPSGERVREAMFNALFSRSAIHDARVLDLFAGSGALGIEALSRGAAEVTFVERDQAALDAVRHNLSTLCLDGAATVVASEALSFLGQGESFDLVLLDPPYGFDQWDELLAAVPRCTIVIESDREIDLPEFWMIHRVKQYGTTVVTLVEARDPVSAGDEGES